MLTEPETVLPDDGEVIETADELPPPLETPLATVTVAVAVPRLLPLESYAIAFTW